MSMSSSHSSSTLRVLHLESGRLVLGGARQVVNLVQGLRAAGVENTIVCPQGSRLIHALPDGTARVHSAPMRSDFDLTTAWHVAGVIRRHAPHVIHVHSRRCLQWLGGLAARSQRVPVVYTRRNPATELPWVARAKYAIYERVIAISACIFEQLVRLGVPAEKLRLVPSGVDLPPPVDDRLGLRRELGLDDDSLVLGSVGQFTRRKRQSEVIEAAQHLLPRYPTLKLILFGSGKLEAALKRQVAAAGLKGVARFAGFRTDVRRLLPALDVVLHPALGEGLGVALLEAAAAGVPIVAARDGGIPDIVRHEINGLLVEPGQVAGLAAAVSKLLDDAELRRRFGAAGRELVARHFTCGQMVAGNLAVYREVLAEHAHRASRRAA
jgi:glycosyltransferase involved in cell wall biosynthesis